jgi:hypothetical protein
VHRFEREDSQNQQVERALNEIGWFAQDGASSQLLTGEYIHAPEPSRATSALGMEDLKE